MQKLILIVSLTAVGLTALWAGGQNPAGSNDEAGLRRAAEALVAAMQAGDINSVVNAWSTDAEYISEDGTPTKGRDAIGNLYKPILPGYKDGKLTAKISQLRFLTPDVAVMDGVMEFTPKDGAPDTNHFSAVWTRSGGKWLVASARDLPEPPGGGLERTINELRWAVGEWTAEDRGSTIKLSVKPDLNNKFLRMEFKVSGGKEPMTIVQYATWDPTEGALRTWMFDSRGGFGQGLWERNASMWQGEVVGVLPTGQVGTSVTYMRMAGPDSFVWQSTEREVEGQPIPDHEIKYTRVVASR